MIIPTISAVSREILLAVPAIQREAAYMLGATKWEVFRMSVLPYVKSGLIGASILGLGRAVGETMAVTMLIGNAVGAKGISIYFSNSQTMASAIANEFNEASPVSFELAALIGLGLILLFVSLGINVCAHLIIRRVTNAHEGAIKRILTSSERRLEFRNYFQHNLSKRMVKDKISTNHNCHSMCCHCNYPAWKYT